MVFYSWKKSFLPTQPLESVVVVVEGVAKKKKVAASSSLCGQWEKVHASAGHSQKEECDKSKICLFHPIPSVSAATAAFRLGSEGMGRRDERVVGERERTKNSPHIVAICISFLFFISIVVLKGHCMVVGGWEEISISQDRRTLILFHSSPRSFSTMAIRMRGGGGDC